MDYQQVKDLEFKFETVHIYKEQKIGSGAFSEVFRATCDGLPCAAKVLHGSDLDNSHLRSSEVFRATCDGLPCAAKVLHGSALDNSHLGSEVFRATCDGLPCAAKVLHGSALDNSHLRSSEVCSKNLHRPLLDYSDPESVRTAEQLSTECQIMRAITHPCVIQYLGTVVGPESGSLAVLMERAICNLTSLLKQHSTPLPLWQQVKLNSDITTGVAYLHENNILHRDLSSSNILICTGGRAKVSDFGTAVLLEGTEVSGQALPGTMVYMPPEATLTGNRQSVSYGFKLDVFSLGVLSVQICTRKYPKPHPPVKAVQAKGAKNKILWTKQSEWERRQSHIQLIIKTNPLLPLALECLRDSCVLRPSAMELSKRIQSILKSRLESSGLICGSVDS